MVVRIDRERCMGNALCVGIAPAMFGLNDDGYATLIPGAVDGALVAEAARLCPTNAIEILEP